MREEKPIRILHLVANVSVGGGIMGTIMNYYRNLDRSKVQFDFVYFTDSDKNYCDEITYLGGKIYKINKPSIRISCFKEIDNFFKLYKGLHKAIHIHEPYLGFAFSPIAKRNGIKYCIIHSHTTKYSDKRMNAIRNFILIQPIRYQTNILFACSKMAGDFLYGKKRSQEVILINNAIESKKFIFDNEIRQSIREEFNVTDKFVVGHIGRFMNQKNHEFLIDIFEKIYERNRNAVLLLVGSGELIEEIRIKVRKMNLENCVIFAGVRSDIGQILQAMDVFILPSHFEGLPIVGIEAQTAGLKCLFATSITNEVCITNNAHLISLKDGAEKWAKVALNYQAGYNRENMYEKICNAGYEIQVEAKRLQEYYLKLEEMDI